MRSAGEDKAKPIVVTKSELMPPYYPNRAISRVEHSLATDEGLEVLHAYVLMFMMRLGRVRATLQIVAERLAFRDFDKTLGLYVGKVLAEPDESLVSYQVLGAEALAAYQARFAEDPAAAVADVFGIAKVERRPELAEVADTRPCDLALRRRGGRQSLRRSTAPSATLPVPRSSSPMSSHPKRTPIERFSTTWSSTPTSTSRRSLRGTSGLS